MTSVEGEVDVATDQHWASGRGPGWWLITVHIRARPPVTRRDLAVDWIAGPGLRVRERVDVPVPLLVTGCSTVAPMGNRTSRLNPHEDAQEPEARVQLDVKVHRT